MTHTRHVSCCIWGAGGRGDSAKTQYDDILANVDYLHGIAESFLTITNLLIVGAFRKAVVSREQQSTEGEIHGNSFEMSTSHQRGRETHEDVGTRHAMSRLPTTLWRQGRED